MKKKKSLGQHFLKDDSIARKIVESLSRTDRYERIVEIGPGQGVLTRHLIKMEGLQYWAVELDRRMVEYLKLSFPGVQDRILEKDMLKMSFQDHFDGPFGVIGNFPYQISSQIIFKLLESKEDVPEIVGMFQRELAERIAANPGNKSYGVISVLTQAFYHVELLFTLGPESFDPPPKVHSAVIRMHRYRTGLRHCTEKQLRFVVKTAFNQRRKMMRNSLKGQIREEAMRNMPVFNRRPEELSVPEFEQLTQLIFKTGKY